MRSKASGSDSLVLVTGVNGFVGSRVARRLAQRGHRVRALVRAGADASELDPRIEWIRGDFVEESIATRAAAGGVDAVVHCAATAGPDLELVRRVNAQGTRSMTEAARAAGVRRYVQISTVSVYAAPLPDPVTEEAPTKGSGDPYGWTKAEADAVVLEAAGRGLSAAILRPGAILGYHPTSTWAVRVPERIRNREVKLRIDGMDLLPWIHVENFVDAVLLALDNDRARGRVYNAVDGHVTWRDYSDEVRAWFGTPPLEILPEPEVPPGAYSTSRIDASRLRSELGYEPRHSYAEGMAEAAAHWKSASAPSR